MPSAPSTLPGWAAAALVGGASAATLVVEIVAIRLLAPFIGLTLEVYTSVIGVILGAIALGAWIGGAVADRRDPRALLGPVLASGGAATMASVPLVNVLGRAVVGGGPAESVLLAAACFLLPGVLLSTVPPLVVKLQLRDLSSTGHVVGRLSAIGTGGALVGTFVAGFVLLPVWPGSRIVMAVGAALAVVGVALALPRGVAAAASAVLLLGGVAGPTLSACDWETRYSCVRLVEDPARHSGRVLWIDTLRHSYVDLADPAHLEFRYTQGLAVLIDGLAAPGPLRGLHIGGGGFTMPRYLADTRPGSTATVVEIDPDLIEITSERLGGRRIPGTTVVAADGRVAIQQPEAGAYDLVVGDAFAGLSVPWHLTTRELVTEVHRVLDDDGLYVLNLIDNPPFRFAAAEVRTLQQVFPHVLLALPSDGARGNALVAATKVPLPVADVRTGLEALGFRPVPPEELARLLHGSTVLSDDYAPVDHLQ